LRIAAATERHVDDIGSFVNSPVNSLKDYRSILTVTSVIKHASGKVTDTTTVRDHAGDALSVSSNRTNGSKDVCTVVAIVLGSIPGLAVHSDANTFAVGIGFVNWAAWYVGMCDLEAGIDNGNLEAVGVIARSRRGRDGRKSSTVCLSLWDAVGHEICRKCHTIFFHIAGRGKKRNP
jgi:hypothetical protein